MRCSRYLNVDRLDVRINGEPFEQVYCFKLVYLRWHVAADGGCERDVLHRMNEGYRREERCKVCMLSNRLLGIHAKKYLYVGVIVPTALYIAEAWGTRSAERRELIFLM